MKGGTALALAALLRSMSAAAQALPADGDPRVEAINYDPARTVVLRATPGYQLMIELSPDEDIKNVAVGDSSAWEVQVDRGTCRVLVEPRRADVTTNFVIVTSIRTYNFELVAVPQSTNDMPYVVRFRYSAAKLPSAETEFVDVAAATRRISRYNMSGSRDLWPTAITNDGRHTFISWPRSASIPAVFALDPHGREVLVNGMMGTDDIYVVEGVPQRLSFRIDRDVAYAVRVAPKKAR